MINYFALPPCLPHKNKGILLRVQLKSTTSKLACFLSALSFLFQVSSRKVVNNVFKVYDVAQRENSTDVYGLQSGRSNNYATTLALCLHSSIQSRQTLVVMACCSSTTQSNLTSEQQLVVISSEAVVVAIFFGKNVA